MGGKNGIFFFFKVSPSPEHDDPNQTVGWKKTVLQKIPLDTPFHYFFFHLMYVLLFPLQYCAAYCKCKFFAASSVNVLYILATILLFFVCVNKSLYCSIIYKTRRLKTSNCSRVEDELNKQCYIHRDRILCTVIRSEEESYLQL